MPARDLLHDIVKKALIKEGWDITHDPFTFSFGGRRVYVDLGAERLMAAEKEGQQIAVEIKSFIGLSKVNDLERAVGQYAVYKSWLSRTEPERILYLAIDSGAYKELFTDIAGQVLLDDYGIKLIAVNLAKEQIEEWIS